MHTLTAFGHGAAVVIVGAGALGSLIGARLARAGQRVVLVGRSAQVQAIGEAGVTLHEESGTCVVPVPASTDIGLVASAGFVLLCVKSADTEAVARAMAPHLRPESAVLSLQNGVANGPVLATVLQRSVMVGAAYVAASMQAPGVVRHAGGQGLVIGCLPGPQGDSLADDAQKQLRLQLQLQQQLQAGGFDVRLSDAPLTELWRKLVVNCACNAISALAQAPYGVMATVPAVRELQQAVLREAVAVAQAEGHTMALDEMQIAVDRVATTMPAQRSSTAQDLARGRRSEIDQLNGQVVRAAARHGIATPANQALWALVLLQEAVQARTSTAGPV